MSLSCHTSSASSYAETRIDYFILILRYGTEVVYGRNVLLKRSQKNQYL